MLVEKFPRITYQGKELQWDLRQKIKNPQIVLRKHISEELKKELLLVPSDSRALVEGEDFEDWGEWIADLYGHPSRELKIIAVCGTNGKTTTTSIIRFLLQKKNKKILEVGTLGAQLWDGSAEPLWSEYTGFTSPEAHTLQSLFKQAVDSNVEYVVMEVTSHAAVLGRVKGIEFDAACFTNFSQDHLDFHGSLEEYKKAKKSFFTEHLLNQKTKRSVLLVLNTDDAVGAELQAELSQSGVLKLVSVKKGETHELLPGSLKLKLRVRGGEYTFPLLGDFQAENVLLSASLVSTLEKTSLETALSHLSSFAGVPGRMQFAEILGSKGLLNFVVDFAHTPDALEKSLKALRGVVGGANKLWVVFGCGGDRDASKRPLMGEIALREADRVIVTSDNPRSEDPQKIIDEVLSSTQKGDISYEKIVDRAEAIRFAFKHMQEGDLCLVAGRGHEEFQLVGSKKIPFRDFDFIRGLAER